MCSSDLPFSAALPNYATLRTHTVRTELPTYTGFSPSLMLSSNKTYAGVHAGDTSKDHNSPAEAGDLRFELFPVQSPLLRESYSFSFPPLTYMLRSEERRVGKSVDLGGRRIIKKKKN